MRNFSKHVVCLAVIHLIIIVAFSDAQDLRGWIFEVVTDSTGGVLPGATVTARSPSLIQPQITVTGKGGSYRFPALPAGLYSLTLKLPGFQTSVRQVLQVNLHVTLTINAALQIAPVEETIVVSTLRITHSGKR